MKHSIFCISKERMLDGPLQRQAIVRILLKQPTTWREVKSDTER